MENDLAHIISDSLIRINACSQNVINSQSVVLDCSTSKIMEYRTSEACQRAIQSNDPNMNAICNPCSITNAQQDIQSRIEMQCGADVQSDIRKNVRRYFNVNPPSVDASANRNIADVINEIIARVSDNDFIAQVNQSVLHYQNITVDSAERSINNVYQSQVTDTVLQALLSMNLTNKKQETNEIVPSRLLDIPNVEQKVPKDPKDEKAANEMKTTFLVYFIIFIFLVFIIYISSNNIRKKKYV